MSESSENLHTRVAALEAENAALRAAEAASHRPRRRSRTVLAVVLILLGVLLSPVALVAGWAKWTLTDTDRFVSTYAPLADDPNVQAFVADEAMAAIDQRIDIDGLTQQLVDGLIDLGTGPRATAALQTLQGSLAEGLRSQIRDGIDQFVASEKFSTAWADALRVGHTQLMATLQGDPAAVATISADGTLGIPLGPIIAQVKEQLMAHGVKLASHIPEVDRTVVLLQSDLLPTVQLVYGAVVALGTWLPWVVLALLLGGVVVANRRHRAVLWAAGGVALAMVVLVVAQAAGRVALQVAIPASVLPGSVSGLLYDTATGAMRSTAISAAVLGAAVALVGWLSGPSRTPTRLRAVYLSGAARLRAVADEHGLSTGRFGDWVYRQRTLAFALVAVLAAIVIILSRPVTPSLVAWTAFWSALALVVLTLIERPATES